MARKPEMAIVKGTLSYPHLFEKYTMAGRTTAAADDFADYDD